MGQNTFDETNTYPALVRIYNIGRGIALLTGGVTLVLIYQLLFTGSVLIENVNFPSVIGCGVLSTLLLIVTEAIPVIINMEYNTRIPGAEAGSEEESDMEGEEPDRVINTQGA